ncbi:MAG: hypothetical protein RBU35_17245 [Anaerolineae bacterium]|jgi:hypothetical protein|nr:hypothetical protein [Anaerolineae bacterium]
MTDQSWFSLAWVLAAGWLGFAIAAVFSHGLRLSRRAFLVPYVAISGIFLYAYSRWGQLDLEALFAHNWHWGLLCGTLATAFLVLNVLSQPASARSAGAALLLDVAWVGVGYGIMDALLLNVMPVVAVWGVFSGAGWQGKLAIGALALLASLLVTLLYHLGYGEFRNRKVLLVLVGNAVITLAFLASGNPLAAIVSHAAMHVAAVFRGPETMLQLPPHYGAQSSRAGEGLSPSAPRAS